MSILKEILDYLRSNSSTPQKIIFLIVIWTAVTAITVALILYFSYKLGNDNTPKITDSSVKEIEPSKKTYALNDTSSFKEESNKNKEEVVESETITVITRQTTRRCTKKTQINNKKKNQIT